VIHSGHCHYCHCHCRWAWASLDLDRLDLDLDLASLEPGPGPQARALGPPDVKGPVSGLYGVHEWLAFRFSGLFEKAARPPGTGGARWRAPGRLHRGLLLPPKHSSQHITNCTFFQRLVSSDSALAHPALKNYPSRVTTA
jgi:hypothetical protein